MAGKVLILRWAGSAYDSLGGLLELTAHELAADGFDVLLFATDAQDWPARLAAVLAEGGFSFALTMSGIGVELMLDGRPIWETAKVPLFNWSCDHPCYFPRRHVVRNPFVLHGYVFPDHARYNIRQLKSNGAAFAVHLGLPPRQLFGAAPLPLASRNGRVIFSKSGQDTNPIEATWRTYPGVLRDLIFAAAEELFARSTADFLPVLQQIGESLGLFLDGNSRLAVLLIQQLDAYIRFRRGNLVLQTVLRYPVDVFGTGWDHIGWAGARARCQGATTWRGMLEQLPRYVGCLSINPLVDESVHDRVFFALSAGVAPISDSNDFSRRHLPGLSRYTFVFRSGDFSRISVEQAIEAVLSDPADALARTEAAWHATATDFSLRHSARQIVQFVALHALNARFEG